MSTPKPEIPENEIPKTLSWLFNLKSQGGAVSVLTVFIASVLLLLRLPQEQIARIKELWWIISIPSVLVLVSWMFTAYIHEMKSRTKVEEGIQGSLATLAANFERLFANHLTDKMYLDKRLDDIEDHLRRIFEVMEKRVGYLPGSDTEKFLKQAKR